MYSLINFIKAIIIVQSINLSFELNFRQQEAINKQDFEDKWIVAIYQYTYVNPNEHELVYKCLGILTKNDTVLASSNCAPMNTERVLRIRRYNWSYYNYLISTKTPFEERFAAKISSFKTGNYINSITLSQPYELDSILPIKKNVHTRKSRNDDRVYNKYYFQPDFCILGSVIHSQIGMQMVNLRFVSMYKPDCCYQYGYATKIETTWFGFVRKETINEDCANRLKEKTCFSQSISLNCKDINVSDGPVLCTNLNTLTSYLQGIFINKYRCVFEVANV